MADIFSNVPGMVIVLDTNDDADNPFRLTIDSFPTTGAQGGVIITEMAIQRHGSYQFLHTLKDLIYVYSFGERIGQIRVSGLAFSQLCNGVQGLSTVLSYYEANRLENRASPISLIIGTTGAGRFRGFLTELNAEVSRPDARLAQFGMQFHALPSATKSQAAPSVPVKQVGFIGPGIGTEVLGGNVRKTAGGRPTTATGGGGTVGGGNLPTTASTLRAGGLSVAGGALTVSRSSVPRRPQRRR